MTASFSLLTRIWFHLIRNSEMHCAIISKSKFSTKLNLPKLKFNKLTRVTINNYSAGDRNGHIDMLLLSVHVLLNQISS